MTDKPIQLDLTASITDVPQANSLPLFIRLMETIAKDGASAADLAEKLDIEGRTISYYVDFGRWLGLLTPHRGGSPDLTDAGRAFAESVAARSRLFTQALFAKPLVQAANAIKREGRDAAGIDQITTRDACLTAIKAMAKLSTSTAERRASGLAQMLDAAYQANRIDWATGEFMAEYRNAIFDFKGRTFLTALAGRQFGSALEYRIGFPRQITHFVANQGRGLSVGIWDRASYTAADSKATWFGSVPVNETTIDIAERGGRDLRKLVVMCAPYVALAVALLTHRDAARRLSVRITNDMYGIRFWEHDREIGAPIQAIENLARRLDLEPVKGVPHKLRHAAEDMIAEGDDATLVGVLAELKILKQDDTAYALATGIEDELRESSDTSMSMDECLKPAREAIKAMLRDLHTDHTD